MMRLLASLLLCALPLWSTEYPKNAAANFPYFSKVKIYLDGEPKKMDGNFAGIMGHRRKDVVFPAYTHADARSLKDNIIPLAHSYFKGRAFPAWFEFAPPQELEGLNIPAAINIAFNGARKPSMASQFLSYMSQQASRFSPDPQTLPVFVTNSFIFDWPRSGNSGESVNGFTTLPYNIKLSARLERKSLQPRSMIVIANNPWVGGFFSRPRAAAQTLAHEIGHAAGLAHVPCANNLMLRRPSAYATNFIKAQTRWFLHWLKFYRP